jgi:hypothetical protein
MPRECGGGPLAGPVSGPNVTGCRAMEAPAISGEDGPMANWDSEGLTAEVRRALDEEASEHGFPNVGFSNAGLGDGWFLSTQRMSR